MLRRRNRRILVALVASVLGSSACRDSLSPIPVGHPRGSTVVSIFLPSTPAGVAISARGVAYVTRIEVDSMAIVDLRRDTIAGAVVLDGGSEDVCFSRTGDTAYVAKTGRYAIGVVNPATRQQVSSIALPGRPLHLALDPEESKLYATMDNGSVAVVDAVTLAVRGTVATGTLPNHLALSATGSRLYVGDSYDNTVTEINTSTDSITRSYLIASASLPGSLPVQGLAVAPGDSLLYVADEGGWITVLSLQSWLRTDSIPVLAAYGLSLTPDATQLWVAQSLRGTITVLDRATAATDSVLTVGGTPRGVVFTVDGGTALVSDPPGHVLIVR